jgi:HEAT repeat protein
MKDSRLTIAGSFLSTEIGLLMPRQPIPPIETLIEQLHGTDWTARCDAARLLGQSRDPRAVDALLPDLEDKDWRVRRNAAQALGALRDKRAVEPLMSALQDRTMTVRQRAIVALGRIKDPQALPALLEIVLQNKHESYDAAKAVRKFGKKALPEIARAYEQSGNEQLMLMLVELKYEGIFEILLGQLEHSTPADRITAIRELGNLGNKEAIPHLLEQLKMDDPMLQSETVRALSKLGATESIPVMLDLLSDDDLYGRRSSVYHAVAEALQVFGGITEEIQNAFPGDYPAMFNMAGAAISLPEAMGLMDKDQSPILLHALERFQNGIEEQGNSNDLLKNLMRNTMEDMAWKVGVMFADARDAKQDRVKRLLELLGSGTALTRAAAALTLPWYGEKRSLEPLSQLTRDPDETVQRAAAWAKSALQKSISYRNQFGM